MGHHSGPAPGSLLLRYHSFESEEVRMLTRRGFAVQLGLGAAAVRALPEMAYAQRAAVNTGALPKDMVWLNANENPLGPPPAVLAAMRDVLPTSNRYHYQEFHDIYSTIAKSEDLQPENLMVGAGSSEGLHLVVDMYTSPTAPSHQRGAGLRRPH